MDAVLRKREKQLARATQTMREVAERIESMVRNGPIAVEPADFLEFAAMLLATRHTILTEQMPTDDAPLRKPRAAKRTSAASLVLGVADSSALLTVARSPARPN